jgi:hypothetical protein
MSGGWEPTVANLASVATNWQIAFIYNVSGAPNGFMSAVSELWEITSTNAYDNTGATENVGSSAGPYPGSVSGNCLPPNCAAGVSWSIPAHYRGGHPRMYLPGVPETALTTPGQPSLASTFRATLAAAAGSFLTKFAEGVVAGIAEELGTVSYSRDNEPLAEPPFYPYTGGEVHGRLDSQRRRLGKEALYP